MGIQNPQSAVCDAAFRRGFSAHAKGQQAVAAAFYELLMEVEPLRARSWHWYGVLRLEQQAPEEALNFISHAINLEAADATMFFNLGNALQALNRHDEAVHGYEAAVALRPDYAQALLNQGNSLRALGRQADSIAVYRAAIVLDPDYASAHFNLANVLTDAGYSDEALVSYDRSIALQSESPDAWCNRGNLLKQMGRLDDALVSYDRAIEMRGDDAVTWSNRGLVNHELGRYQTAVTDFEQAIHLRPAYVNAICNKGNSLRMLHMGEQSLQCYDLALSLDADHARAHCNRGLLLRQMQDSAAAMQAFDNAINSDPRMAEAFSNRALLHKDLGDFAQSMRDQQQAIALNPQLADAHANLGALLHDLNRIDEAIASHRRAIALNANHPHANWNLSLDLILSGDLQAGWPLYEWRLRKGTEAITNMKQGRPRWDGQLALKDRRLLLVHEQGLGDTLQFCRYVPLLESAGGEIWLEAPASLHGVLQSLSPRLKLFDIDTCNDGFDLWLPLMSLPLVLGEQLDSLATQTAYLEASPSLVDAWASRVGAASKTSAALRVGLCVSGNPLHQNSHNRDLPLHALLAQLPQTVQLHLLQQQVSDQERIALEQSPLAVAVWDASLNDFSETAALCANMDLVITVDTSVAHLSAALGRPTWILLPWVPDWRWFQTRSDSPWYPSVRLFRQTAMGRWDDVIQAVIDALNERISGSSHGQ